MHDVESNNEIESETELPQTCRIQIDRLLELQMTSSEDDVEIIASSTSILSNDDFGNASKGELFAERTHGPICAVCLDPFQNGDVVSYSSDLSLCSHEYHQRCISEWLMKCYQCPVCRSNYIPIPPPPAPSPIDFTDATPTSTSDVGTTDQTM